MNEHKLIALDIDGTLAGTDKTISERNINVLDEAQSKGIKVALVSGRPCYGIWPTARKIHLDKWGGYILSFNGGKIVDCKNNNCIYEQVLSHSDLSEICKEVAEYGLNAITYADDVLISDNASNKYVQKESSINKMPVCQVVDLVSATDFPTPKCLVVGEPDILEKVEKDMYKRFPNLSVFRSEPFFLEFMPKGVDKAYSLAILLDKLKMCPSQLLSCGDGFNDLSMIKYAGMGVAMQNAQQVVKDAANYICPYTNDEDAVAFVIEKYVL